MKRFLLFVVMLISTLNIIANEPIDNNIHEVTFTVKVPNATQECYVAGSPKWTHFPMEKVDGEENLFTLTTTKLDGNEWLYCSGPGWGYVEVTVDGSEMVNRTESNNPDVVEKWKLLYDPDSQPVDVMVYFKNTENWEIVKIKGDVHQGVVIENLNEEMDVVVRGGDWYSFPISGYNANIYFTNGDTIQTKEEMISLSSPALYYKYGEGWVDGFDVESLIFFDETSMLYYCITSDTTVTVIPTQNEDVPYSGDIVVPNQIYRYGNRYDVTAIHDNAFRTNNNTYSITLPESLVSIGSNVFPNTISFIELPGNVADISEYAFEWADNLSAINVSLFNENYASHDGVLYDKSKETLLYCPAAKSSSYQIPEGVKTIKERAFHSCSLWQIHIPSTLTTIEKNAFGGWMRDSLEMISVSESNSTYLGYEGVLYTKDSTELLYYPPAKRDTSFVLPFGNKVIAKGAIDNPYIKEITLCKALTSIENSNYMPNVTKIIANPVLPPMVKNVATFPFEAELVVNGNMERYLKDEYWSNFLDLKRIYFKNTAAFDSVYVHYWAEYRYNYSTTYPGKKMQPVEGQDDWYYCDILPLAENVIFSAGGVTYENHANRTKTADIVLDDANPYFIYSTGSWVSSFDQKGDTTLSYQFNDDGTATLVADADYKFRGEFNIPSTITRDGKTYSVTQIASEAFRGTFSTVIRIPQSIKSVGEDAFNYGYHHKHRIYYEGTIADWCAIEFANLKSIPQTIEHSELWMEGKLLQDLYLPSTVKSIGNYAFANYNLRSVNLSGQLKSIGESSFEGCTNLRTVILGENITSMGSKAFYNASGVTEVYANMPTPPVFNQFFGGDDVNLSLIKLYVPEKYVSVYRGMDGWKEFDIVPVVDEEITDDQVHTKPSINSVVIQWPAVQEADTYTINIWIDVDQTELICSLVFNKYGMLVNITFERNAVDADLKGFSHIITGLDANQTYFYSVETKDEEDNIIDTQVGEFVTIDIPTSIQDVADNITLTASNGRIDANADFTIYNVLGKNVTSHNGHLKGVYIVSINDERYKILVP